MKKILVFGLSPIMGGVERYIETIIDNIDKKKYHFDFLMCENETIPFYDKALKNGCRVFQFYSLDKKKFITTCRKLDKFFSENRYDIIYYNTSSLRRLEIFRYAKKHGIEQRIIHSHNSNFGYEPKWYVKCIEYYYKINITKYATDLLACSDSAGNFLYGKKIFKVIPNPIDISNFKRNLIIKKKIILQLGLKNKIIFGYVGRLSIQKNLIYTIKVFAEINKLQPNSFLVIVGDGDQKQAIIRYIKKLNIENKVLLYGFTNKANEVMQCFDYLLLLSLYEGFPITLIEAQALGIKCFVSNRITESVAITDLITFVNIDATPKDAAIDIIEKMKNTPKYSYESYNQIVSDKGYGISSTINTLDHIFSNK